MPLWTRAELAQWVQTVGGEVHGELPDRVGGIAIDSRTLQAGDVFFAVKGERLDGHDYVAAAAEKGAALLVVEKARYAEAAAKLQAGKKAVAVPIAAVEDTLKALEHLGRAARERLAPSAKLAAITGSVGKTTVKEMLAAVLRQFGKVHLSPASFNNHWGVPLTLARMPRDTDYALYEIGMNHAGEITPLVAMVRPHLVMITNIAAAHMGHFHSLQDIAAAKAEIFSGLEHNGTALLNRDDKQYDFLRQKLEEAEHYVLFGFGRDKDATYRLTAETPQPNGQKIAVSWNGKAAHEFILNAYGSHMALNACAVVAAAGEMVIAPHFEKLAAQEERFPGTVTNMGAALAPDWEKIGMGLQHFHAGAGRGARHKVSLFSHGKKAGAFTLIDESYNANPLSMAQALKLLAAVNVKTEGRRIAVLGDMLELGATARREHEALAAHIIAAKINIVFLVGENMQVLRDTLQKTAPDVTVHWQQTREGITQDLKAIVRNGDAVVIKGSNSVGLGNVVQELLS